MYDYKFLIFGGTTEGRLMVEYLSSKNVLVDVYVVTKYGGELLPQNENIRIYTECLDADAMIAVMAKGSYNMVIDATHPYAKDATKNIVSACINSKMEYTRLLRDESEFVANGNTWIVNTPHEAIELLNKSEGKILFTTGSKDLKIYADGINDKERIYARILPVSESLELAEESGIKADKIICMQGPFSVEMNYTILCEIGAEFMVTKEAGTVGGFSEKLEAAKRAGIITIVIGRVPEEKGLSFDAVKYMLSQRYFPEDKGVKREVYVIGIGMGNPNNLTIEAKKYLDESQVIIGARRIVEAVGEYKKPNYIAYVAEDILEYINKNVQYDKIAVVFSGDIGFYSGAKHLIPLLSKFKTHMVAGISSLEYLSSKLKMPWEDIKCVSIHGRVINLINHVHKNRRVFVLLDEKHNVNYVCKNLIDSKIENIKIYVGEMLSYDNERVISGTPEELYDLEFNKNSVVIIENTGLILGISDKEYETTSSSIADSEFIRGKVPMTKAEVRTIIISKLKLSRNSVVYDIGAGTGSVTLESAMQANKGQVFAFEKNPEGIELIKKNLAKFEISNVTVVEGNAEEQIRKFINPTHAFIGGTDGKLSDILDILWSKNPIMRIVVTAITLETQSLLLKYIEMHSDISAEIVQVAITNIKKLGKYHMPFAKNPVMIITLCKEKID
jgi:precorrin-6x reductase